MALPESLGWGLVLGFNLEGSKAPLGFLFQVDPCIANNNIQ